jgi:hypothetical protein
MRLRATEPDRLRFFSSARGGSLVFIGVAIALIGSIALFAPGPMTVMRAATAFAFAVLSGSLIVPSVRASQAAELDVSRRDLVYGARRVPLGKTPRLRLSGQVGDVRRLRPAYGASLVVDGESFQLLDDVDPAAVLEGVRAIVRVLPMEVEPAWGLPAEAIAEQRPAVPAASRGDLVLSGPLGANRREAGWTVAAVGALIAFMMARSIYVRVTGGTPATLVGYLAPIAVTCSIGLTAALVLTSRTTIRLDGRLGWERSALGISFRRRSIPISELRGIHSVGPVPEQKLHVLFDCGREVVSLPCPGGDAEQRVQQIESALRMGPPPGDRAP